MTAEMSPGLNAAEDSGDLGMLFWLLFNVRRTKDNIKSTCAGLLLAVKISP
jgi:hypothetical protein